MDTLKDIINLDLKITEPPEAEPPPAIAAKAIVQAVNSETGEINPNFVYDDDVVEPELPEFKPKPTPDTDIFIEEEAPPKPKPPQVKVVPEGDPQVSNAKPVKLNKNGKPRKKMSPEHLEKLKVAREKAAAKKMEDIQQASLNAILKVEALRKERKAEKKKKAQIDQYNQQTMKSLNKMEAKQPSWYIKDSPYNGLF